MRQLMHFNFEGMKELHKTLKEFGDVPQKHVTAAAKKATTKLVKAAKANAPELTGDLKKGIIPIGERQPYKAKKIYQIVFDRSMNDIFQKTAVHAKHLVMYHGQGRRSKDPRMEANTGYYPISQEYGYFTRNGRYIPGFYFIHNALRDNRREYEITIINVMQKRMDAELAKGGLKLK